MDITKIDKNFLPVEAGDASGLVYYDITKPPFSLHGVFYDEKRKGYYRMPQDVAEAINESSKGISEGLAVLNKHTAGGRLRFSTDANKMCVVVKYKGLFRMPHMTLRGNAGFALGRNTQEGERYLGSIGPTHNDENGFKGWFHLPKTGGSYTLHFPLYHEVDSVFIGFPETASVWEGMPYRDIKPVLYYGSSITQGGCANRPDTSYEDFICRKNNVDYINLGFSGSALAEPGMVDYLATIDCSVAVFDYDYNAPTKEWLKNTHFAMYERYRKQRPDTPVVFITKPNYFVDATAKARWRIIKKTYNRAKALGDENVYFIDGRKLFGKEWDVCTVDNTHPTDLGFYKMAQTIGRVVNKIIEKK